MKRGTKEIIKGIKGNARLLSGSHYRWVRQEIIHNLTGLKLAVYKCGVNKLEQIIIKESGIDTTGMCRAKIQAELKKWAETL